MLYEAKNNIIKIDHTDMNYISFGEGSRNLIILPGLGDSLKNTKGLAHAYALAYRLFAREYKVYVFSRKNKLPEDYSTRDMAEEQVQVMKRLGIEKADFMGISMGGMICQYIAIDHPETVNRLVLVATMSEPNEIMTDSIITWQQMARKKDFQSLMTSISERMYTDEYMKKLKVVLPLTATVGAPKSYDRFFVMARACRKHNAYNELEKITAPTLVIGGELDATLGADPSRTIAERISGSQLYMYEEYGHGMYEEAKDFQERVYAFLIGELQ